MATAPEGSVWEPYHLVTEELSDLAGLPDWEDGVQSCL